MNNDYQYAEMLQLMRSQGSKDNPETIKIGVMLSPNSVKLDDLTLLPEDLYIADHLMGGYSRELSIPYVSDAKLNVTMGRYDVQDVSITLTKQNTLSMTGSDGLKAGDLVAMQRLDNNMYLIFARVVRAG